MIRLAVLGFHHETNTFSSALADLAYYRDGGIFVGERLIAEFQDSKATFAGFLAGSTDEQDVQVVPLLAAMVNPCGPVTEEAFDVIVGDMLDLLRSQGPFEGVLLGLHGAAVAHGHPSADADIAALVRDVVGPAVPVAAVVDLHANVDPRLVAAVDILVPYQTNPHVDAADRGRECRGLLVRSIRAGRRPVLVLEQLPLVVNIVRQDTSEEPLASALALARQLEQTPGVDDVSVLEGFPYADVPQMGMSVTAMADTAVAARSAARTVADWLWAHRAELQGGGADVDEAIGAVITRSADAGPLLLLDVGDNIGGGGPGDSTALLAPAVGRAAAGLVMTIFDPAAVEALAETAIGDRVMLAVGGHSSEQDGKPVPVRGTVVGRHDGRYEEPVIAHGGFRFFDPGRMIAITTDEQVTVVLTSKVVQTVSAQQLIVLGLDPSSFRAIVGKGVNAPRAGFAAICPDLLVVDTPGVTRLSLEGFHYRLRRRPMYPFEPDTAYRSTD
jgi:microcystin degradation protein MlrC